MRVHARRHDTSTLSSRLVFAWTTFPVVCEHALSRVKYHGTCMAHPKCGISHARNMESRVHELNAMKHAWHPYHECDI